MPYAMFSEEQERALCDEAQARKSQHQTVSCRELAKLRQQLFNLSTTPDRSIVPHNLRICH